MWLKFSLICVLPQGAIAAAFLHNVSYCIQLTPQRIIQFYVFTTWKHLAFIIPVGETLIKRHLDHKTHELRFSQTNSAAIIENNIFPTFYMGKLKNDWTKSRSIHGSFKFKYKFFIVINLQHTPHIGWVPWDKSNIHIWVGPMAGPDEQRPASSPWF